MATLHTEIFEKFSLAAMDHGVYPERLTHANTVFAQEFERWQDLATFSKLQLDPAVTGGYDTCWLMVPVVRRMQKRARNARVTVILVAQDTASKKITVITGEADTDGVKAMAEDSAHTSNIVSKVLDYKNSPHFGIANQFSIIDALFKKYLPLVVWAAVTRAQHAAHRLKSSKSNRKSVKGIVQDTTEVVFRQRYEEMMADIRSNIVADDMAFADNLYRTHPRNITGDLRIYNHLRRAQGEKAREFRKGALLVLGKVKNFFWDDKNLWEAIDNGAPLYDALSKSLNLKISTVRRMFRQPDVFGIGDRFATLATALDKVDPAFWPDTGREVFYFAFVHDFGIRYASTFERNLQDVLKNWLATARKNGHHGWEALFKSQFAEYLDRAENDRSFRGWDYDMDGDIVKSLPMNRLVDGLSDSAPKTAIKFYRDTIGNINHMRNDVSLRLIRAGLILEFEKRGLQVASTTILDDLAKAVSSRMWASCPPSEQIEASSYWHSPRINFRNRFESVAISSNTASKWPTIIDGPVELSGGVIAYPLNSTDLLREEGTAMNHCVWSFTNNCLTQNFHVFSLRNKEGQRISTLTIKDGVDGNKRSFSSIEHKRHGNGTPSQQAFQAEKSFLKMLDEGVIMPDWTVIDKARAEFMRDALDQTIGYDFRNPAQRERVLDLFKPCIPRKALHGILGFDALMQKIGVPHIVTDHLAKNSQMQGILPMAPRPPAP
ncbi:MAG: PcfJ domain-containing protein [Alphaproteobacteria bacterium]|nr:PcfJ domain-containing protein [Alphaproteobacteria bacterium]